MNVAIPHVIPDLLGLNLDGIGVEGGQVMVSRMVGMIPAAPYVGTNQADPQVGGPPAVRAGGGMVGKGVIVVVTANGAEWGRDLSQTRDMEGVIASRDEDRRREGRERGRGGGGGGKAGEGFEADDAMREVLFIGTERGQGTAAFSICVAGCGACAVVMIPGR